MTILIVCGVAVAILMAYTSYFSNMNDIFKSLILIGMLLLGTVAFTTYQQLLGTPIKSVPEGNFVYIHHIVTSDNMILIWLIDDQEYHKLYEFAYNREMMEKMNDAGAKIQNGDEVQLSFDDNYADGLSLNEWKPLTNTVNKD